MLTPVSNLLITHSHYDFYLSSWQTIKDLREGYATLLNKKSRYLPIRIGEEQSVYNNRLGCLSYTNILNENIHRLCSILTSAPITTDYSDNPFWDAVISNTNGKGKGLHDIMYDIYAGLLYYGRLTIGVDNPVITDSARSLLEYRTAQQYPKLTIFNPLEVINWGDDWCMTYQVEESNQPLQPNRTFATWKLWTSETITTWKVEVQVDIDNRITLVKVNGKWLNPLDKKAVIEGSELLHGWGLLPIVRYQLPDEKWVGSAVYPKALQHFNIESSYTWAGRYAGIIQRVFTPLAPVANDNPALLIEPPDYSQLKSDNAHILIGQGFEFVETTGKAIECLGNQLTAIKLDVKDTVNITFASGAPIEQSGVAKKVDMLLLRNALTSYGYLGLTLIKQAFETIAVIAQTETPAITSNLSYTLEDTDDALTTADRLLPHIEHMSSVAILEFYKKLQHLLLPDATADVKQAIDDNTPIPLANVTQRVRVDLAKSQQLK